MTERSETMTELFDVVEKGLRHSCTMQSRECLNNTCEKGDALAALAKLKEDAAQTLELIEQVGCHEAREEAARAQIAALTAEKEQAITISARRINEADVLRDRMEQAIKERDELESELKQHDFVRCDMPACNCNGWHGGHSARRLTEIGEALQDADVSTNGRTILEAVQYVIKERDEARESANRCDSQASDYHAGWMKAESRAAHLEGALRSIRHQSHGPAMLRIARAALSAPAEPPQEEAGSHGATCDCPGCLQAPGILSDAPVEPPKLATPEQLTDAKEKLALYQKALFEGDDPTDSDSGPFPWKDAHWKKLRVEPATPPTRVCVHCGGDHEGECPKRGRGCATCRGLAAGTIARHEECPQCKRWTVPGWGAAEAPPGARAGENSYLVEPLALAVLFHEIYESLAPANGYETRTETRVFDPESKNGMLMVATCREIQSVLSRTVPEAPLTQGERSEIIASLAKILDAARHCTPTQIERALHFIVGEAESLHARLSAPEPPVADRAISAPEEPSAGPFDISDGRNRYRPCPKCHANSGMGYSQGGIACISCGFKGPQMGGQPAAWKDKWAFDAWNDLPRHEDTAMLDWLSESTNISAVDISEIVNGHRWRGVYRGKLRGAIRAAMRKP